MVYLRKLLLVSLFVAVGGGLSSPGLIAQTREQEYDDTVEITREPRLELLEPTQDAAGRRVIQLPAAATSGNVPVKVRATARRSPVSTVNIRIGNGAPVVVPRASGDGNDGRYDYGLNGAPAGTSSILIGGTLANGGSESLGPIDIVLNRPPTVSITTPSAATAIVTAPTVYALTATTSEDAGDFVTKVEFLKKRTGTADLPSIIDTVPGVSGQNLFTGNWSLNNSDGGTYDVTARAYDNFGGIRDSNPKTITVCASTVPTITGPTANQLFQVPTTTGAINVTLTATITIPVGCSFPSSLSFYSGASPTSGSLIGGVPTLSTVGQTRTFTQTWSGVAGGVYNLSARAVYGSTNADTAAATSFRVNRPPASVAISAPTPDTVYALTPLSTTVNVPVTATATENLDTADGVKTIDVLLDGNATPVATQTFGISQGSKTTSGLTANGVSFPAGSVIGLRNLSARATDNFNGIAASTNVPIYIGHALSNNNSTLQQAGFELPRTATNADVLRPTGSAWVYTGESGIRANTSGLVAPEPTPPVSGQTPQMAYLRCGPGLTTGSITQVIVPQLFATGGQTRPFKLKFRGAFLSTGSQSVKITVTDIVNPGSPFTETLSPASSASFNQLITSGTFSLTSGRVYAIKLEAGACAADRTAYVDDVVLELQNAPATVAIDTASVPARIQFLNPTTPVVTPRASVGDPDNATGSVTTTFYYQKTAPTTGDVTQIGNPVVVNLTNGNIATANPGWIPDAAGTYSVFARASDGVQPAATESSSVTLVVNAAPVVTSVSVTSPSAGAAAVMNGANVTLSATATDVNGVGDITSIRFVRPGSADQLATPTNGVATTNYNSIAGLPPVASATSTGTGAAQNTSFSAIARDADNRQSVPSGSVPLTICRGPDITVTMLGSENIRSATGLPTIVLPSGQSSTSAVITATATTGNNLCGTVPSFSVALVNGANETPISPNLTLSGTTTNLSASGQTFASGQTHRLRFRATTNAQSALITARTTTFDYVFEVLNNAPPVISSAIVSPGTDGAASIRIYAEDPNGDALTVSATGATSCAIYGGYCDLSVAGISGVVSVTVTASDGNGGTATQTVTVASSETPNALQSVNTPDGANTSVVGTTAGTFTVGEGGAATYSIPIQVSPGVNGLQPNLSLNYSSQAGNGHLGVGWSLGGLSSITRCPKTIATDGVKEGINYDSDPNNDAFCMDGQRLIVTRGRTDTGLTNNYTDPATGSPVSETVWETEFRTEVESYSRILAYQEWGFKGPTRFLVKSKSGQTLEYGARYWVLSFGGLTTTNQNCTDTAPGDQRCHVIKQWMLDRVTDSSGNVMTIDYAGTNVLLASGFSGGVAARLRVTPSAANPPTEVYPTNISYGVNRVEFSHTARPAGDESRLFDSGGGETLLSQKLDSVSTFTDSSTPVKTYKLAYTSAGRALSTVTNRLLLKSVEECDASNRCLPKTQFGWKGQAVGNAYTDTLVGSPLLGETEIFFYQVGDLIGDGRSAAVKVNTGQKDAGFWRYNPSSGWVKQVWTTTGDGYTKSEFLLADSNGDGRSDWMQYRSTGSPGVNICRSLGSSFETCSATASIPIPTEGLVLNGDFDGDGNIDFMFYRGRTSTEFKFDVYWSSASGIVNPTLPKNVSFPIEPGTTLLKAEEQFLISDFDGDGKSDVFYKRTSDASPIEPTTNAPQNNWKVCFGKNRTTAFECPSVWSVGPYQKASFRNTSRGGDNVRKDLLTLSDFNGDGLADVAWPVLVGSVPGGEWYVCLSAGEGSFSRLPFGAGGANTTTSAAALCSKVPGPSGQYATLENVVLGDFNGDGRTDIAVWDGNLHPDNSRWNIYFSKGSSNLLDSSQNANNGVRFDCSAAQDGTAPGGTGTCKQWTLGGPGDPTPRTVRVGDFLGVGKTSFLIENFGTRHFVLGFDNQSDLLGSISTGLGATTSIEYAPLTDASVYARGTDATAVNELTIQSPMYVVKSTSASNGLASGAFKNDYFYESLRGTTNGRGLIGFSKRRSIDSLGIVTETTYNNTLGTGANWAIAGRPLRVTKCAPKTDANVGSATLITSAAEGASNTCNYPGYALVNRVVNTWATRLSLSSYAGVVEAFSTFSKEESWELPVGVATVGIALPSSESSTPLTQHDAYGNVLSTTSSSDGGAFVKTTTNTYYAADTRGSGTDTYRNWIVGRLKESTVAHTGGTQSVTRKSKFTYHATGILNGISPPSEDQGAGSCDARPGLLCTEEVEPAYAASNSAERDLYTKTVYKYDTFGNRKETSIQFYDRDISGILSSQLTTRTTSVTYETSGRFPLTVKNARNDTETRTYDPRFGGVTSTTGPNGLFSETIYDGFGRKVRERSYDSSSPTGNVVSDAVWTTTTGGSCGQNARYTITRNISGGAEAQVVYDNLQREVCSRTVNFAGGWATATTSYDSFGRKEVTVKPAGSGNLRTVVTYDTLSRPVCEFASSARSIAPSVCASTDIGTALDETKATTAYAGLTVSTTQYGANGGVGATDPVKALTTSRTKNSQGWVVTLTDSATKDTTYAYNAIGNMTSVTAPGSYTENFTYDRRGRKISMSSPDAGSGWEYKYNGAGELSEQKDARGYITRTIFDVLGRPTERREYEAGSTYFETLTIYDNCPDASAKGIGKVCEITSGYNGIVKTRSIMRYDNVGRPSTSVTLIDNRVFTSATAYDSLGRAYEQGTPGGVVLRTTFQSAGGLYPVSVVQEGNNVTHWQATGRNNDGSIVSMTVGGVTTGKTYDGLGRIKTINTGASNTVQAATYGFDAIGNLVSRTDSPNGIASSGFTYDTMNRLSTWTGAFAGAAGYDANGNGNITSKTDVTGYAYQPGTHRISQATHSGQSWFYDYDANGNVKSASHGSINPFNGKFFETYTAFNLPRDASVKQAGIPTSYLNWVYDGGHNRVREVSSVHGTTYFMGGYERVERDRTDVATANNGSAYTGCLEERTYIATPEGMVGLITNRSASCAGGATSAPAYWHKDHLGSLVAVTDASQQVTARFRFDPWGLRQCGSGANFNTWTVACNAQNNEERGFTGHEMLDELGFVHMNGRLYDPITGRMLQADPIIQDAYNSQNYNRYSYVLNNPLSMTDPTGFSWWTKWRKTVFAVAAAIVVPWALTELFMANATVGGALAEIGAAEIISLTSSGKAVAAMAGGFAAGGISGGNIQSALQGAFTAALTFGVGELSGAHGIGGTAAMSAGQRVGQIAGHAAVGCASHAAAGGSCKAGAMSAGFSAIAGHVPGISDTGLIGRMAVGAIASKVGGGKAENGAMSAAFEYLFNEICSPDGGCSLKRYGERVWNYVGSQFGRVLPGRVPDAVSLDTGAYVASASVQQSRDGDVFRAGGTGRPYPSPEFKSLSVSATLQFIDGGMDMTRAERAGILGGPQLGGTVCHFGGCVGRAYSPTDSGAWVGTWSFGIGIPGGSLGWSYSGYWKNRYGHVPPSGK